MKALFQPYHRMDLKNRIVMAPMTRSRASADHIPTPIMATYYGQRATAGMIITEGVAPSPNGVGYARIPGIYSQQQMEAWKPVTTAVHRKGGKIFIQLMHTGRISHPQNMPEGARVFAPSALAATNTKMYVDGAGELELPEPTEMTEDDIRKTVKEYARAARWSMEAGFDGVEIHGANGYLVEQFLNPNANQREDAYGGTPGNRNRFALEVAEAVVTAIGAPRTGIRLSPNGVFNDVGPFEGQQAQYEHLVRGLDTLEVAYIHLVNHEALGANPLPDALRDSIRAAYNGTLILSGGYEATRAEADLSSGHGDLIAFGRPFISNPDLAERIRQGNALADPDFSTFYTPGEVGYTDYPKAKS